MKNIIVLIGLFLSVHLQAQFTPYVEHLSKIMLMNERGEFIPKTNYELTSYLYNDWVVKDTMPLDSCHYYLIDSTDTVFTPPFFILDYSHQQTEYFDYDATGRMLRKYLVDLATGDLLRDEYLTWTTDSVSQVKVNGGDSLKTIYHLDNGQLQKEIYFHLDTDWVLDSSLYYTYDSNGRVFSETCIAANGDTLLHLVYVVTWIDQLPYSLILAPEPYTITSNTSSMIDNGYYFMVVNNWWESFNVLHDSNTDEILGTGALRGYFYVDSLGQEKGMNRLTTTYDGVLMKESSFSRLHDTIIDSRLFKVQYFWRGHATRAKAVQQIDRQALQLYPNPTSGIFHLLEYSPVSSSHIRIYNQLGQQVQQMPLLSNEVDASALHKGIYYYNITEYGAVKYTGRFIKQ